jgi:hypothetical protein
MLRKGQTPEQAPASGRLSFGTTFSSRMTDRREQSSLLWTLKRQQEGTVEVVGESDDDKLNISK